MITDNLKELLLERSEGSELNFTDLIEMLEVSEYEFIGCSLRGPMGLATHNKAYYNMLILPRMDDEFIFFVILHEYCHVKSIDRMGKDKMVTNLSEEDFDVFVDHIVGEEILADRFSSLCFYNFNKREYPRYRTQRLEEEDSKYAYREVIREIHGQISDEESYDKTINSYILK